MFKEKMKKQTENRRTDGKFAPGNTLGKKFEPGITGNPAGRPKLTALTEALRVELAKKMPDADERTQAEAIAQALVKEALAGDVSAIREIADRTEGKPKQSVDLDMQLTDWRELARMHGISESDVIREAKRLIAESAFDSSGA